MIFKIKNIFNKEKIKPKKIKLEILGISYTTYAEQKIYIVVLGEEKGERKVPVIVSFYEAQAIATEIEKILPISPLIFAVNEILSLLLPQVKALYPGISNSFPL